MSVHIVVYCNTQMDDLDKDYSPYQDTVVLGVIVVRPVGCTIMPRD
jgi:hypothetical protein